MKKGSLENNIHAGNQSKAAQKKKHVAPRSQLNGNGQLNFQRKPYPRNGGSLTCLNPTPCLSIVVVNLDDLGYFNFGKPPSEPL